jgi:hypothetical protein
MNDREAVERAREKVRHVRSNRERREQPGSLQTLLDQLGAERVASLQHSGHIAWWKSYEEEVGDLADRLEAATEQNDALERDNKRLTDEVGRLRELRQALDGEVEDYLKGEDLDDDPESLARKNALLIHALESGRQENRKLRELTALLANGVKEMGGYMPAGNYASELMTELFGGKEG